MLKGFHHPKGSHQTFQRRAMRAGQYGVEVAEYRPPEPGYSTSISHIEEFREVSTKTLHH